KTVTADRDLAAAGRKAPARRKVADKGAAAIMLQAWLDHRRLHPEGSPTCATATTRPAAAPSPCPATATPTSRAGRRDRRSAGPVPAIRTTSGPTTPGTGAGPTTTSTRATQATTPRATRTGTTTGTARARTTAATTPARPP